ncbi:MAG: ABC transporter permease [Candidatus Methylophosphatis roskildensis]
MNLLRLATRELRANPLSALLAALLLTFGIATLVVLLLFVRQIEARFSRDARGIDLVVGAKGSPMQLILSGVYHLDAPTGNIPLDEAKRLARLPMVKKAIPLGLGDSFSGFRIVGAPVDYIEHYAATLSSGRLYDKPMEAVLGAEVARHAALAPGGILVGSHGIAAGGQAHGDKPYQVVGVLQPTGTPLDRLVLTPIESVWAVHEAHEEPGDHPAAAHDDDEQATGVPHDGEPAREVTVVLLQYASPLAAVQMPRLVNQSGVLQAASPAFEIARLMRLIGVGRDVMNAFAALLIAASAAALLVALLSALRGRQYDIAVMRLLGASRAKIFATVVIEALLLTTSGALGGLLLGHLLAEGLGSWLAAEGQPAISGRHGSIEELWLLPLAWLIGLVAAVLPAIRAAHTDVAGLLAKG